MAQQLRTLVILSKDLTLIPSTHMTAHNYLNLCPRGSTSLRQHCIQMVCRHTYQKNTHTNKIVLNFLNY